jgi:hypothetical protein
LNDLGVPNFAALHFSPSKDKSIDTFIPVSPLIHGLTRGVKGTNTIKFIRREDTPAGRKATYGFFVVEIKAHK